LHRAARIVLFGGSAAAWPLAAHAQQPEMPVVGFLGVPSAAPYARYVAAVHHGLKEVGYIEHQNVAMEYRWADGQYDRLPALVADLVSRRVAVIVPIGGAPATVAAKETTSTIPIIFKAVATDDSRIPRSRTPLDARASRPCCRKCHRPACGTKSSWLLAVVLRRSNTHSPAAHRRAGQRRQPHSQRSVRAPW
jgi:hypothetical protein